MYIHKNLQYSDDYYMVHYISLQIYCSVNQRREFEIGQYNINEHS